MNTIPSDLIKATNALTGQLLAVETLDVLVKNVHLIQEVKYNNELVKANGVFLVIECEVANLGKHFINVFETMVRLLDDNDNEISRLLNINAIFGLNEMGYRIRRSPSPGFVGLDLLYYDLPLTVTNLKFQAHPSYMAPSRQPSLESFKFSGGKGPDSGAGQELVGKTYNRKAKIKAKIFKVDRLTEINKEDKKIIPEGIFLVVAYELENNSKKPVHWPSFQLRDSTGRVYDTGTTNSEAFGALSRSYKRNITVNPGEKGLGYQVYELVKEAEGLEIAPGFFDR